MFRRAVLVVAVAGIVSSCTFAQIAQLEQMKGPITEADKVTIEALPDVPIVVDEAVIEVDGTITTIPEEALAPRDRLDLAISRTSWAARPDLHGWVRCVAKRESNFDPRAFNPRNRDRSYGYMQINMRAHSLDRFGITSEEQLFHPETNLEAAYVLFEAAGTSPWRATRSGC